MAAGAFRFEHRDDVERGVVAEELAELLLVVGDAVTLDRLLADEFTFVGGPNKAQYLASVKSKSADTYVEFAVSDDVQVQVYGNAAVVTGVDTVKGKTNGQSYENRYLYMDVWVKRSGRWQCVKTYSSLSGKH